MKKLAIVAVSAGLLTTSAIGVAGATGSTATTTTNAIPKTVLRTERQDAVAQVLNTTTDKVEAAHKDKTFAALVKAAGLTHNEFMSKVKAQLTADLKAKGYSQAQIDKAMKHAADWHHHKHTPKN